MISGTAIDRFDRLSRLRAFRYDRFKIYSIVPIVSIELNSLQAIEVFPQSSGSFAIDRVAFPYDRPILWDDWDDPDDPVDYMETGLYPPKLSFDTWISRWCVPLIRTEYLQLLIGSLITLSCAFCNASVLMCFKKTLEAVSKLKCIICRS